MKYPLAIVGMVAVLMTFAACSAPAQDDGTLEARISTLETKLSSIEANLGKLDVISEQLVKLREAADANRTATSDAATQPADAVDETKAAADTFDDVAPSEPRPRGVAGQSSDADNPALAGRVKTLEETIAAIEQQLKKLDDIAEQVILFSDERLAAGKRERSDLVELSGKVSSAAPESSAVAQEGTVIVNNWTGVIHFVAINGKTYRVAPGQSEIKTQYGVLTTQLVEYEAPQQWEASRWKNVDGNYQVTLDLKN
jgi:uncharacterized coiled-coil protein SlyX